MNLVKGLHGTIKKETIRAFRVKERNFEIKPDNHPNSVTVV